MNMTRVLLVDDHTSVQEGTKYMIEQIDNMKVYTASSGEEALEMIKNEMYDLYIFDLFLPNVTGLDLTKYLISKNPHAIVLIHTGFDIEPYYNNLIESGVSGFISKSDSKDVFQASIKFALKGISLIPITLLRQLRRNETTAVNSNGSYLDISLTEKEKEVLYEVARGKTNAEISEDIKLSQRMVEKHISMVFGKLNVKSRVEAVTRAKELKLVPDKMLD
ncbi:response regulator containing a CheY-like receiver domain and an HTH DNA-binding domain [Schinkia azotoformans MEV2011]|uniref:Response regulator containing a CheY-like receiver domain and an HTH DNA-binding domain n=1 Tax=Schinkia azotoformans MEV2011 TaxID=1348973 RepID=A0A072P2D2_SCHAZ|nr:response regulator transcription factor [Schinkia azotoformans]KEF39615.1 response regulator containing a CheY-like receiver domain and an HTH DNA-binding domain [Schinkia azotoformans MEV2011]MEC1694304.1 response regulator transcription factor [Schinkia azotoformans]MEC1723482.1 response regulator transcription factor [Schinkia azotoformans]MEC1742832.1 response regulator transcription factor [Schinkia azotoformans]MEC1766015.1 response regulator transcription factor [Schinkia azotoforman